MELQNRNSPSIVIQANWFTATIKVQELQFSLTAVTEMEVDSFRANAFQSVTKLVVTNTSIDTFKVGLFNGLDSLEILHFKEVSDTTQKIIENGVLDVLNRTLTELKFEELTRSSNEIVIDGFTGSAVLSKLRTVKFTCNLKKSITNKSFVGLEMVKNLDLSFCQIETIGEGSFDAMTTSIEILNLDNNFIKTLPDGLFDIMLTSNYIAIHLEGNNKWICDCSLEPFKINLMKHSSNFIGAVECDSPLEHKGFEVTERDLCVAPTTTLIDTEITTEIPTTPDEFSQECFQQGKIDEVSDIVAIKTPSQKFSIVKNENGGTVLQIDGPMENRTLIWFSLNHNVTHFNDDYEINCLIASNTFIQITNLTQKSISAYTFCLMNSTENTISPLDCISYTTQDNNHALAWFNGSKKGFAITMITITCSSTVLIGMALGYFTLKRSTNRKQNLDSIRSNDIT